MSLPGPGTLAPWHPGSPEHPTWRSGPNYASWTCHSARRSALWGLASAEERVEQASSGGRGSDLSTSPGLSGYGGMGLRGAVCKHVCSPTAAVRGGDQKTWEGLSIAQASPEVWTAGTWQLEPLGRGRTLARVPSIDLACPTTLYLKPGPHMDRVTQHPPCSLLSTGLLPG